MTALAQECQFSHWDAWSAVFSALYGARPVRYGAGVGFAREDAARSSREKRRWPTDLHRMRRNIIESKAKHSHLREFISWAKIFDASLFLVGDHQKSADGPRLGLRSSSWARGVRGFGNI